MLGKLFRRRKPEPANERGLAMLMEAAVAMAKVDPAALGLRAD